MASTAIMPEFTMTCCNWMQLPWTSGKTSASSAERGYPSVVAQPRPTSVQRASCDGFDVQVRRYQSINDLFNRTRYSNHCVPDLGPAGQIPLHVDRASDASGKCRERLQGFPLRQDDDDVARSPRDEFAGFGDR